KKTVKLSTRQMEILQLIAEGYSTKQMGDMLCLSTKTVEKHRQGLMTKLDIHNVANLTRYAVTNGVVPSKL
ncbi:MAG TPA: LuxR C-terminal-related transcriptional regulator, partial [Verrucomicrobiae bacterium]|nr:LuxR C-terminal-related transcriptional regulator [Verrucomicrobiae bacterium]